MSVSPVFLAPGQHLEWRRLLEVLESPATAGRLPAKVVCRRCGDWLRIFQDSLLGGAWYVCRGCTFAGDGVELAALHWEVSIATALLKLSRHFSIPPGFLTPDGMAAYQRAHISRREQVSQLWASWQARRGNSILYEHPQADEARRPSDPGTLYRNLGIALHDPDLASKFARYSAFLGVTTVDEVTHQLPDMPGAFRGAGWRTLLAVPFWDLPGRIAGFLFVGRNAGPEDWVFRPVLRNTAGKPTTNTGVALLPQLPKARNEQDAALVVHDARAALSLQFRHLRDNTQPLPVLLVLDGQRSSQSLRDVLPKRRLLCWSPTITPAVLRRAVAWDAEVATNVPDATDVGKYIRRYAPVEFLALCDRSAASGRALLEQRLQASSMAASEDLMTLLGWGHAELASFLAGSPKSLQTQLQGLVQELQPPVVASIPGMQVVERSGRWWDANTGRQLCNAAVRVNQMAVCRDRQTMYYSGVILFSGREYPFTVSERELQQPVRWLERVMTAAGAGPLVCDHRIGGNLLTIAKALHTPQIVSGLSLVGWHAQQQAFLFPGWTLHSNGLIEEQRQQLWAEDTPCCGLRPEPLTVRTLTRFSGDDKAVAAAWATLVAVLQAGLAPAVSQRPHSVAVVSSVSDHVVAQLAEAMGCLTHTIDRWTPGLPNRLARMAEHSWPLMLRCPRVRESSNPKLLCNLPPGSLVEARWNAAYALSLLDHWSVLDIGGELVFDTESLLQEIGAVLVAYLHDLCRRQLQLPVAADLELSLFADLARWWQGQEGNPAAIQRAAALLISPRSNPRRVDRIGRLLARLCLSGRLYYHRTAEIPGDPRAIAVTPAGRVHIPRNSVAAAIAAEVKHTIDLTVITQTLQAAGILLEEGEHAHQLGWFAPQEWFEQHLTSWKMVRDKLYATES